MSLLTRARKGLDQASMASSLGHVSTIPFDRISYGTSGLSPEYAVNVVTVYQCVTLLADTFAQIPLVLYRRAGGSRERATDHPLYRTFHDAPNPAMSSFLWRRIVMGHLATWGNSYNEIVRVGNGEVQLWPFRPDRIEVKWADGGESRRYWYHSPTGDRTELDPDRMFHLQGFSSDGLVGVPPISSMRRAIGLYRKAENYGEAVFDNGARPAIVMRHPKTLTPGAVERLGAQMDGLRGSGNAGKSVVLEEGLEVTEIGFPPEDAQFMETRLFQKREVATGYGIPLAAVGDPEFADEKEDETSRKLIKRMAAHFTNFQQEAQLQVIGDPDLYVEFLVDGYLWGDPKARADALAVAWEHGVINADTWNQIENRPPLPDGLGQTYWRPANWVDVAEKAVPVGGDASVPTQFGRPGQGQESVDDSEAEVVDQLTRAKGLGFPKPGDPAMAQFDCPACGKMINRMAAPGTIGYCKSCRAEKVMGTVAA